MENLHENQNSQGSDTLSGTKSVVQDDINVTKSGECGQGDNFHNEILDQNTCQENIKNTSETISCEADKTVDDIPSTIESENEKNVENVSSVVGEEEKEPLEEEEEEEEDEKEEEENTTQTVSEASEEIRKENVDSESVKESQIEEPQAQDKTNHTSNIMDESQDGEHFGASNADQETPTAEMTAEEDVPGATNETINMDVEEANADQDCPKEDEEMTLDGKEKETSGFEMSDKVAEDDLEENLSQDDEVSMNPSEPNANPAEEESSMNVSEGGEGEQSMEGEDQSMDQDMQVEHTDKDGAETMDVSMANVDVHGGGDESMEVASPNDEDPIGFMNDTDPKDATSEEQMEVNESVEDNAKPEDEMEDGIRNEEEIRESSKQTEDVESTKQTETEDSITKNNEETEDTNTEKDKTGEETEVSGTVNTETCDDKPENVENKDEENSEKEKDGKETEGVDDGKQAVDNTTCVDDGKQAVDNSTCVDDGKQAVDNSTCVDDGKQAVDNTTCSAETTTEDKNDTPSQRESGDKTVSDEASGKEKDDEEVCIVPDTVLRVGEKESDKEDGKDGKNENKETEAANFDVTPTKSEKPAVIEVVEKPKPSRKSSNAEKKGDAPFMAAIEPVVEHRHSRPQRQAAKRAETQIKELAEEDSNSNEGFGDRVSDDVIEIEPSTQMCVQCCRLRSCRFQVYVAGKARYLCQEECFNLYRKQGGCKAKSGLLLNDKGKPVTIDPDRSFIRKCSQCSNLITGDEKNLSWETMDYCNEECLGKYQTALGSHCANCKGAVQPVSLGKYCVRFGYDIKQFCCSTCLEEFKKGLKVCSYCQKDISSGVEGFLAPVGDKGQFKDFCTQACMEKYDQMSNNQPPPVAMHQCAVCNNEKIVKVEVILENKLHKLCSEPCFAAFKFVNKVNADHCDMCKKYFDKSKTEIFSVYYDDAPHSFCCKTCMNVYILANRKIVPCNWCKVKKYNFDMIKRVTASGQVLMMCSLNCLTLYQVSVNAVSSKRIKCDLCNSMAQAQYHLTMSDATIRNFCSYPCVMSFQGQYSKTTTPITFSGGSDATPIPAGGPKRAFPRRSVPLTQNENQISTNKTPGPASMPVISNVTSLATQNGQASNQNNSGITTRSAALKVNNNNIQATQPAKTPPVMYKQQVIVKPPAPKQMKNKSILCKPYMHTKGVSCRPHPCTKETQTDDSLSKKLLIPVPVPIYVPAPMHMYSTPFPVPVPFPLPVPVPIFVPTTRNSAHGIMKEIKKIQEKIPTDPFEAELLMMAEMVAGEKKGDNSDSESDDGGNGADVSEVPGGSSAAEGGFSPEAVDTSNTFGEDMLQMALKMASELEEPAVDLEAALTPSTITAQSQTSMEQNDATESEVDDPEPVQVMPETRSTRGRKRGMRTSRGGTPSKRGRRISSSVDIPLLPPPEPQAPPRVEQEKPDANMCLKYTFGVNAWRQWVMTKNAELEKAATNNRKLKLFKPEILQLTADELNYSLCLFVKEVRKPNGTEYAPDTIYYLCLGIQQYLFENGRIDNIFTDSYYEKFTECLDEVAKKFTALYNDSQYIVTRVEEEHLWESKQLGAHSPHVLLSTLMFFNTKHFNLTTVDEHMQLSFSHIMKHWKRNPNQPGVTKIPGSSRNVLLRFYPPQSALEANSRKKKVYEQQENEENPLRCPVKLYEFYLSKCPESVKTRNDVFYLLPERSCVPDSPVWYSTMALGKEPLIKMLHRVKMVKEINIALLTS